MFHRIRSPVRGGGYVVAPPGAGEWETVAAAGEGGTANAQEGSKVARE
jgi:hypothetical protein